MKQMLDFMQLIHFTLSFLSKSANYVPLKAPHRTTFPQTLPIPREFNEERLRRGFIRPPAVPGGTWFAVVVAKYKDHFDGAGRPNGSLRSKQRMLQSLGYRDGL